MTVLLKFCCFTVVTMQFEEVALSSIYSVMIERIRSGSSVAVKQCITDLLSSFEKIWICFCYLLTSKELVTYIPISLNISLFPLFCLEAKYG